MGFEQLNEGLSHPSWEREGARCRFLTLLFYFAAASPSRCLNVTDYFTAGRTSGGGSTGGREKSGERFPNYQHPRCPGCGTETRGWKGRVENSPSGKQEPCPGQEPTCRGLQTPEEPALAPIYCDPLHTGSQCLAGSGNISPRLLFGACQQRSFVKQRPSCQATQSARSAFPPGSSRASSRSSRSFCQPQGAGRPGVWQGDRSAPPRSSPAHGVQMRWGTWGDQAGERQGSPVWVNSRDLCAASEQSKATRLTAPAAAQG